MTTLDEFFTSLHHGERSNERFGYWQYFMHARGDATIEDFFADLLDVVGTSIDDGQWRRVIDCVQRWDQRYADFFIDELPYTKTRINSTVPWARLRWPLEESRVALITSGGILKADDQPFGPGDSPKDQAQQFRRFYELHPTYRVIPRDYPRDQLRVSHPSYDYSAVLRDVNVLFPLDRFTELERDGVIGELAPENYSYMGLTNPERVDDELVPSLVEALHSQEVQAVFITPG